MTSTKKISLSVMNSELSMSEMEMIQAGSGFCTGWGAVAAVYEGGVIFNLWNPIGWGGQAIIWGVGAYCLLH